MGKNWRELLIWLQHLLRQGGSRPILAGSTFSQGNPKMTKPIFATPKMPKDMSEKIYNKLRQTEASPEQRQFLEKADQVFRSAKTSGKTDPSRTSRR